MFRTIRWRLAATYALLILLSVTLMGVLALSFVQRSVERQEREYLKANAESVAFQAERFLAPQVRRIAIEELAATSAFLGDVRVRILGPDKAVMADSGDPGMPDEFLWVIPSALAEIDTDRHGLTPFILPIPSRARGDQRASPRDLMPLLRDLPLGSSQLYARRVPTPWGRRFVFEGEPLPDRAQAAPVRTFLSITTPIGAPGAPLGFVELSSPISQSAQAIGTVRTAVLFSGLGSLLVAVAFGFLVGRTISDPLRGLAAAARRMSGGDLAARASENRRDEIGQLARQFNAMAASLERSFRELSAERDSLKRFVADASHEMRTPLTALATFNELLQGSAAADPRAREEFLRESQGQLERLQWITANLLDLSRLDAGIASLEIGVRAAADMVETACAGVRLRAHEKGVTLAAEGIDPGVRIACDGNRVELALANLVANAVKFVPPTGTVRVEARPVAGGAEFVVSDDGPGIAAEDLPRVFDRFYRGRNATPEGAGLGLAIVQSVANAHSGSVRVESSAGKGSTFTLFIPSRE